MELGAGPIHGQERRLETRLHDYMIRESRFHWNFANRVLRAVVAKVKQAVSKLSRDRSGILSISAAICRDWHGEPHYYLLLHSPLPPDANGGLCVSETFLRVLQLRNDIQIVSGYCLPFVTVVGVLSPFPGR